MKGIAKVNKTRMKLVVIVAIAIPLKKNQNIVKLKTIASIIILTIKKGIKFMIISSKASNQSITLIIIAIIITAIATLIMPRREIIKKTIKKSKEDSRDMMTL